MKKLMFWRNWTDIEQYLLWFAIFFVFCIVVMVLGSAHGSR